MCAPAPPAPPDFNALARDQGQANIDAVRTQGKFNNPNVISPYGTQIVKYGTGVDEEAFKKAQEDYKHWKSISDPWTLEHGPFPMGQKYGPTPEMFTYGDPNQATLTQTLAPEQQALLDESNRAKLGLSQLATQGVGALKGVVGKPVDFSTIGTTQDKLYNAMMSRFNEDFTRGKDVSHSNLISAGLRPGSKAYDDAMALMERTKTDADQQAWLKSRKDAIAEMLMERQVPINEISALMSGSQVSNPFAMPGYAQNAQVQAAPIFAGGQAGWDAASDIYNAKAAQAAQLQQGLFGLGSAGIMGGAMYAASDRRLKSNIQRLGTHPFGIGVYEYDIFGRHERGVMADEVMTVKPEAVLFNPSGYWMVDYAKLGGRP